MSRLKRLAEKLKGSKPVEPPSQKPIRVPLDAIIEAVNVEIACRFPDASSAVYLKRASELDKTV